MSAGGLPDWPPASVGVLCVAGPHAIPVSTAVRVDSGRVLIALGARRETLARLERDGRAALCLIVAGAAFSAEGEARVVRAELEGAPGVCAVELAVDRVQDHLADGRTAIDAGPAWRWVDAEAAERDRAVRAALERLA